MPFAGWDWASTSHAVTVVDAAGSVVDGWTCAHTEPDLDATLSRLASHAPPAELPVAIEATNGLVVDRLLAAGHPVIPVHATAFHAARPRWSAAGAKSDPGDSYKLSPTTCAPTTTGCAGSSRWTPPPASCRPWSACAPTTSPPRPPPATSCGPCSGPTGPAPGPSGSASPCRSRWTSLPPTQPHRRPPGSPRPTWPRSAAATPTAAARAPPNSWGGCTAPRRRRVAWTRPCSAAWSPRRSRSYAPSWRASPNSSGRSSGTLPSTPRHGCSPRSRTPARSASPSCWPSSAPSWTAPAAPTRRPPRPAPSPSPAPRARPPRSASAWPPTATPAKPCTSSPTTPATARPGRPSSTPTPARGKRHPEAVRILGRAWLRVIWACWHTDTPYDPAKHRAEQRLAA